MSRLFLAIPIPLEVRNYLAGTQDKFKSLFSGRRVTWVHPENFHLTLHFIGEVEESKIAPLKEDLAKGGYPASFTLCLTHIDTFPHKKYPKILFVGTNTPPSLPSLYAITEEILVNRQLCPDKKPFYPHFTLGRIRARSGSLLPKRHSASSLEFSVDHFVLMKSVLTPEGSTYEALGTYSLRHPQERDGME